MHRKEEAGCRVSKGFTRSVRPDVITMSNKPEAAGLSESLVAAFSDFFGCTMTAFSGRGSGSMAKSLTKEKLSHALPSIVMLSMSENSAEKPDELGTADMAVLSAFWTSSVRTAFFFRRSPVSRV